MSLIGGKIGLKIIQALGIKAGEGKGVELLKVIDDLFTTDKELAELELEYQAKENKEQAEINKIEAAHPSLFVAGWRPAIGWICAIGALSHFVLFPWIVTLTGLQPEDMPNTNWQELAVLLSSMLGVSYHRNRDKARGTDTKGISNNKAKNFIRKIF